MRVTFPSDGVIEPRMYSYWSNAYVRGQDAYVFCGRVGSTPAFFRVDLETGESYRIAPMVRYLGTTEGWYWDRDGWIYIIDGPRLRRVNAFGPGDEVVFEVSILNQDCDLWQAHSSDDGRVHCASVRRVVSEGSYPIVGVVHVRDNIKTFYPASETGPVDESAITSDGRYLVIKVSPDDDNLVIDTDTGDRQLLLKRDGALGHSDCGPSYMVGADRDHEPRACVRWDLNKPLTMENRVLIARSDDWSEGDLGHVSVKAGRCVISDAVGVYTVGLYSGAGKTLLFEHGMRGDDYDHQVQANLDPSGRVICYLTNSGTDRTDVHLVRLSGAAAPLVTTTPTGRPKMKFLAFLRALIDALRNNKPVPPSDPVCGVAVVVTDQSAAVLPGATAIVGAQTATTNKDGYHEFDGVPQSTPDRPVPVLVTVSKDGYTTVAGSYKFEAANQQVPVQLRQTVVPPPPLPARPTRDQACLVANQLQGITCGTDVLVNGQWVRTPDSEVPSGATTRPHHLFDPEIGWAADKEFRMAAYTAHKAVKLPNGTPKPDTHICLSLDMTGLAGLAQLKSVIREAITEGGMTGVLLMCMGDGNEAGKENHDPGALNYPWVLANFTPIVDFMEQGEDLTPYIVFVPGFDGVIPGWQPWSRVNAWLQVARARLDRLSWGQGYLGLEFSFGYWSWSGERDDLASPEGQMVDVPLYEMPIDWGPPEAPPANLLLPDGTDWAQSASNQQRAPWTDIWLLNRIIGALYIRPAMQPKNYEPSPPYSNGMTPRGRNYKIIWERDTYMWCKSYCDENYVNQHTQVVIDLGADLF